MAIQTDDAPRWDVVDRDGTVIYPAMWRRENAEREAAHLNAEGLPEFAPYTVQPTASESDAR